MKSRNEVVIGAALILAAVVFFLGNRYFEGRPLFGRTNSFYTDLPHSQGLVSGHRVSISGVFVGSVEEVFLIEGRARVVFSIEPDVPLHRGARATFSGLSFFGNSELHLIQGPEDAPLHESGDEIPADISPNLLDELANSAPQLLSRADTLIASTREAVGSVETLFNGGDGSLVRTLAAVEGSAAALNLLLTAEQNSLEAVFADIDAITSTLASFANDSLLVIASDLRIVLHRLEGSLNALERTNVELSSFLSSINRGQGTLGLLVTDDSLYHELTGSAAALRRVLEGFESDPDQYLRHLKLIDLF